MTVFLCVGPGLTVTVTFTLLRMVAHPCCSLEVRWTPLVSLLFTKPKLSHTNDRTHVRISKERLVLVLGQEINSLTVILRFRGHGSQSTLYIPASFLHLHAVSHMTSDDFLPYYHIGASDIPTLNTHRFDDVKKDGAFQKYIRLHLFIFNEWKNNQTIWGRFLRAFNGDV